LPKHAPLKETELKDKLVYHPGDYKTLIDTIRIACANAESELASVLAPALRRPGEAKKVLANIFAAPGQVRVNGKSITICGCPEKVDRLIILPKQPPVQLVSHSPLG
jgi:hypothetical protein